MKEIIMTDCLGFCFGVKRAVDEITNALTGEDKVWAIGMPIHNPQEVERLKTKGLKIVNDASEIPSGVKVLIRTHGEPKAVTSALRSRGVDFVDTTCPFVRRAQERAAELSLQGYYIILLGDERHPEIRSIMGYVDGPISVVAGVEDARKLPKMPYVALISQTTQQEELLTKVASVLVSKAGELYVCNTVCKATVERQEAVRRLAGKVDGVVIVGGKESANTAKLMDITTESGMDALWIESASGMDWRWLDGKARIGIAAGASTPEWLIMEVCKAIKQVKPCI